LDLGQTAPSNAYLSQEDLQRPEKTYPLRVFVCPNCWLVQTEDYAGSEDLFRPDYAYFSSTSTSWLSHAKKFSYEVISKLKLDKKSFVVEVACNDGYLLKNFVASGISCLGIEPTASTAAAAEQLGIPVLRKFFGESLARSLEAVDQKADLIIGNNVYAHVPDLQDFTRGLAALLKTDGVVSLEFPHLLHLMRSTQFDTIYHEHFSYFSLSVVCKIFAAHGLKIWDVDELSTHGGSLRVYGCHDPSSRNISPKIAEILKKEKEAGLLEREAYQGFQAQAEKIKQELLRFLQKCKEAGKKVAGYGAAAKGNTLLNYAGIKTSLLPYVCDAAPSKQGKYLPGSHIPIYAPPRLFIEKPDFILIFPWNLADEILSQLRSFLPATTQMVVCIPQLRIL
jgi:SAM-dependent methyltransferase